MLFSIYTLGEDAGSLRKLVLPSFQKLSFIIEILPAVRICYPTKAYYKQDDEQHILLQGEGLKKERKKGKHLSAS